MRAVALLVLACCGGRIEGAEAGADASLADVVVKVENLKNGSFEQGGICHMWGIPKGSTIIPGWTVIEGSVDWEGPPLACGWQPSEGSDSLDLVGDRTGGIGGVEQTLQTAPGTKYVVTFDLAGNYGAPPVVKPLTVTVDGVTMTYLFDTTGRSATNMGWTTKSFSFVATKASATLRFVSDISASGFTNAGAALDNVRVSP